jgi:cysteine-rich repeat protein
MYRLIALSLLAACSVESSTSLDALPGDQLPPTFSLLLSGGGSSLVIGEPLALVVEGATPSSRIHIVRGGPGGPLCPPVLGGSCVDLVNPTVMTILTADAAGVATLNANVPSTLPVGLDVVFHAVELGATPALVSSPLFGTTTTCGDSVLDAGESCDDGNPLSGDGCSATCEVEQSGYVSIVAGYDDSCALDTAGEAVCWGSNAFGLATVPAGPWVDLSLGRYHACGVQDDDTLACWGLNNDGQISAPAMPFTQVSAGPNYSCGVGVDQIARCWGFDAQGQVSTTPTTASFRQVSAGARHVCAVQWGATGSGAGPIACWGENAIGESSPPSGNFLQITAGGSFSCGVTATNTLACWGADNNGQATPPSGTGWLQVEAGNGHACALRNDGAIACWGWNGHGQTLPPLGTYQAIGATNGWSNHHCAVLDDGTAVCWGEDNAGETTPPL